VLIPRQKESYHVSDKIQNQRGIGKRNRRSKPKKKYETVNFDESIAYTTLHSMGFSNFGFYPAGNVESTRVILKHPYSVEYGEKIV
jgi:hypothetical protein